MPTETQMEELRGQIHKRTRFPEIESVIEPPENDEIDAAIFDAVDDINSLEPETSHSLDSILEMSDTRWKRLVILGASANVIRMILFDWTANGIDIDLGDGVQLSTKVGEYESLLSNLREEFDDKLEKLKTAALKISKVRTFTTSQGLNRISSFSRRSERYFKSARYS